MARSHDIELMDGAMGTELHRRGIDVSGSLFSAQAVLDSPDMVEAIHRDYLEAGADIITTATFRAHRRSLARAGLDTQAGEVVSEAVRLAHAAREAVKPHARVLGSVGPLEDCYSPQAAPREEICAREHGEMIDMLLEAGVDGVLIETIGTLREAAGAAAEAARRAPGRWIISFLTSEGPPQGVGTLLDGESLVDLLPSLRQAQAVGINCTAAADMLPQVGVLRDLLPPGVAVAAYANTARRDEHGQWRDTDAVDPQRYAQYARSWIERGATMVGGCCGTTPATIRAIAAIVPH